MITPFIWGLLIVIGIALLVLSTIGQAGSLHQDLCGGLSWIIIFIAAACSWSVDTVTGYGVVADDGFYALLENHTIYHYDAVGILLVLIWVGCWINLFRLWLDYRRISKQEELMKDQSLKQQMGRGGDPANQKGGGAAPDSMNTTDNKIGYK